MEDLDSTIWTLYNVKTKVHRWYAAFRVSCDIDSNCPHGLCHSQQSPSWSVTKPTISHIFSDTISNSHDQLHSHLPHGLCHSQQCASRSVPQLTIFLRVCATVNNLPYFLTLSATLMISNKVSFPHALCQSAISLMVCVTVSNLPHGQCHDRQSPSWPVPQSAISLRVCGSQKISLCVCATVSNLPQGLCHDQQSPSRSVPQSVISLMVCVTVSNLP